MQVWTVSVPVLVLVLVKDRPELVVVPSVAGRLVVPVVPRVLVVQVPPL
ncbi:hypothetical protein [Arthrobacter cheniae]|nr:hypothetical protein [Arthrobacter cheniae]